MPLFIDSAAVTIALMFILIIILIEICCSISKKNKLLLLELKSKKTDIQFLIEYVKFDDKLHNASLDSTERQNILVYKFALERCRKQLSDLHIV